MIPANATAPFSKEVLVLSTTVAKIEPMAMVLAKSKLDIFAKVRSPEIRVMVMMTVKMMTIDASTFNNKGN